jgi:NADPH2:quinone reductase
MISALAISEREHLIRFDAVQPRYNLLFRAIEAEITTTFASHYTAEVSLADALRLDVIVEYSKRATGEKHLINPNQ